MRKLHNYSFAKLLSIHHLLTYCQVNPPPPLVFAPTRKFFLGKVHDLLSVNTNISDPEYHFCVKYGRSNARHSVMAGAKLQKVLKLFQISQEIISLSNETSERFYLSARKHDLSRTSSVYM